jgi:two-component system NtrC family response regulator
MPPADDSKPRLLIVEDDESAVRQLRWTFDDFEVATAGDRLSAIGHIRRQHFPVVLLDLGLPPEAEGASEGLAALTEIRELSPETKVIVVTGREERAHALRAVELGAHDYFQKPASADEIRLIVDRALRLHHLEEESQRLERTASRTSLPGIVATSEQMLGVCRMVERAAASDISVLLLGESGTGKELLARALHELSARSGGALVAINCAAIPANLLEAELFGYERGAFTGAVKRTPGHIELASGGTLFLDEIGDMPIELQAKMLRFLEERVLQRLGGRTNIEIDTRLVCATNQDLQARIREGSFREDLYYRIAELTISIPPLRERPEDARALAHHFFERHRGQAPRALRGLTPGAIEAIAAHAWPGNARELDNRMKRAVLLAGGREVTAADLEFAEAEEPSSSLKEVLGEAQRGVLQRAWAEADGNVSKLSKLLGVSRPTAYKLLREHGLKE